MQTSATACQTNGQLPIHVQHLTARAAIPSATSTLTEAFEADPVTAYMLNHLPHTARSAALQALFYLSNHAAILSGGELYSASTTTPSATTIPDFQAAAVILPPGKSLDGISLSALPSLLLGGGLASALWNVGPTRLLSRLDAYGAAMTPAKKSTFPNGEQYYYVQTIGAGSLHRGKGLAPALLREVQGRAAKEGSVVYLEASNLGAKRVYEKLGFKDVADEIRMGVGECDEQGEVATGEAAVGVPLWPMLWVPEGHVRGGS